VNINLAAFVKCGIDIGDYYFNTALPLEWQIGELRAEMECPECGLDHDCRKCHNYEFSLLYAIQIASEEGK